MTKLYGTETRVHTGQIDTEEDDGDATASQEAEKKDIHVIF